MSASPPTADAAQLSKLSEIQAALAQSKAAVEFHAAEALKARAAYDQVAASVQLPGATTGAVQGTVAAAAAAAAALQ